MNARTLRSGTRKDYKLMSLGVAMADNLAQSSSAGGLEDDGSGDTREAAGSEESQDDEYYPMVNAGMRAVQAELDLVKKEKRRLLRSQKKMELEKLTAELEREKYDLANLQVQSKGRDSSIGRSMNIGFAGGANVEHDKVKGFVSSSANVDKLRKMGSLNKVVMGQMRSLGLGDDDDDTDDSSSSSSDDGSTAKAKKHRKYKKRKSGITAKASDRVKAPQVWPHSTLQVTHISKAVTFENLTFSMFVAGESEILSSLSKTDEEMSGRLSMLRQIAYYKDTYSWQSLLDLYAAWLRQIELCQRKWLDDTTQLEHVILAGRKQSEQQVTKHDKHDKPVKSRFTRESKSGDDSVWFCSGYQRNKCSFKKSHMLVIKGQMRSVEHICATCWQKDSTKLGHPESSSECPHQA
jgi:hypothetical protein